MSESEAEIILRLAKDKGALMFGEFKLSAGGTSSYYFDGRIITLDPEAGYHVAKAILPILRQCRAQASAGQTPALRKSLRPCWPCWESRCPGGWTGAR